LISFVIAADSYWVLDAPYLISFVVAAESYWMVGLSYEGVAFWETRETIRWPVTVKTGIDEGVGGGTWARVFPSALQDFPQSVDNCHYIDALGHVVAVEVNQIPHAVAFRLDLADNGLRPTSNFEA
jgi:hypothetical protein